MRSWVLGLLAVLVVAAPAAAQSPGPTLLSFDCADPPGLYTATLVERAPAGCNGLLSFEGILPHSAPLFLYAPCQPTLRLAFPVPQTSVQLFARALLGAATELVATGHTVTGATVTVTVAQPGDWKPI